MAAGRGKGRGNASAGVRPGRGRASARREAARDHAALAGALDPIITIDASGTIQSASDSVERLFGWKPAELHGKNVRVLMPEPHHSAHDGYLERYRKTGRTEILNRPRRFDAVRKDGTLFPIELSVSRANMPGQPLFVGIIRDASLLVQAEKSSSENRDQLQDQVTEQTRALEAAHLRLRMADRLASIGTLAAGLGHDMHNVLLPVRARLNALRAKGGRGGISASALEQVEGIRKSVAYLQQLADGLHFLAMDPEKEVAEEASLDVRAWWDQVGVLVSRAVPKHVKVMASIPPGLPPVRIPGHALTQAVLNLVVNAGEAIPAERKRRQGRVRVWVENDGAGKDGAWLKLGVSDNGEGMSEEVKRRAFEMFYTTKPRGLGTGLGLALVHKVVDRAGGRVEIDSRAGEGTTVVMHLPVVGRAGAWAKAGPVPRAVVSVTDGRAAALVEHLLGAAGVRVERAEEPGDADIWVADPGGARAGAAKAWRRRRPRGRLVLLGVPSAGAAGAWRALGVDTIERPDDFDSVRSALGRAVAG